jgi:hypothetical protein
MAAVGAEALEKVSPVVAGKQELEVVGALRPVATEDRMVEDGSRVNLLKEAPVALDLPPAIMAEERLAAEVVSEIRAAYPMVEADTEAVLVATGDTAATAVPAAAKADGPGLPATELPVRLVSVPQARGVEVMDIADG